MPTNPEKVEGPKPEKKRKGGADGGRKPKSNPKLAIVQDAIRLMDEAGIGELHFEQAGVKIHLRKGQGATFAPMVQVAAPAPSTTPSVPVATAPSAAPAKSDNTVTLNSPMVGTFYRAASPDAKPFIEEGGKIAVGQVYCIVEAMKLMNEVKSEVAGKVVKILVQNGQAIEFNQPLLIIDPS